MSAKVKGFILLELAIVLCVIGCIGAMFFPSIKISIIHKKALVTQQNFDVVLRALAVYKANNNRLPFAGDDEGLEIKGKLIGKLPYKSLFLEKKVACNGDREILFYIVDKQIVFARQEIELEAKNNKDEEVFSNFIYVFDETGDLLTVLDQKNVDFCAVVLISISKNSSLELESIISEEGDNIIVKTPQKSLGVDIRWISNNNLDALSL
ncbi:MAG: type II secretion system GspH family protein [Holosporales bacterium]|jgi:hypothetical protein|nr:type II secretion system GspH family protein [Holosporales bacterium]